MLNKSKSRNRFTDGDWLLCQVDDLKFCGSFDCGDHDLNEYFREDALLHKAELIGQSYCLQSRKYPNVTFALLDFCNDSISFDWGNKWYRKEIEINHRKRYKSLPAVKITRFGVQKDLQDQNIGTKALNMVKKFFVTDNRTGCRFITVDAYNKDEVLRFYKKNNFTLIPYQDTSKDTLAMFFDLKRFIINP